MKTFLFDTLNRFRRFSENLDVKATLCNRPWQVFNDSGEKELYIFQEDGTLLITYSGRVTHSTWQYIAANKSIVISAGQQSYMVHPAFMDKVLFALQVDGTNECAFLIDENNAQNFAPRSYASLMGYFEEKERKALEEERRRVQAEIGESMRKMREAAEMARLKALEEEKSKELEKQRKRAAKERERLDELSRIYNREIKHRFSEKWGLVNKLTLWTVAIVGMLYYIVGYWNNLKTESFFILIPLLIPLLILVGRFLTFLIYIVMKLLDHLLLKRSFKRYIKRYPNDEKIPDLIDYHNRGVRCKWRKISNEEWHWLLYGK